MAKKFPTELLNQVLCKWRGFCDAGYFHVLLLRTARHRTPHHALLAVRLQGEVKCKELAKAAGRWNMSGMVIRKVTPFGVLVARTHEVESDALAKDVTATIVCNGVSVNKFTLRLQDKSEVRLYAKREALEYRKRLAGSSSESKYSVTVTSRLPKYRYTKYLSKCSAKLSGVGI